MITLFLIFFFSQPDLALQFLCVTGLCLGVAIFLHGLRLRRTGALLPAPPELISSRSNAHSFPQHTERLAPDRIQQIIRLSPDSVPAKSAEMTQQQKIAAALARAGTSHSTSWLHESTAVATEPDPSEQETIPVQELPRVPSPTPKLAGSSHLLIWSGLALVVLSCYLLVTIR